MGDLWRYVWLYVDVANIPPEYFGFHNVFRFCRYFIFSYCL